MFDDWPACSVPLLKLPERFDPEAFVAPMVKGDWLGNVVPENEVAVCDVLSTFTN